MNAADFANFTAANFLALLPVETCSRLWLRGECERKARAIELYVCTAKGFLASEMREHPRTLERFPDAYVASYAALETRLAQAEILREVGERVHPKYAVPGHLRVASAYR